MSASVPSLLNGLVAEQPQLAFGVGCFHFADTRTSPKRFDADDYIARVKASLGQIPAIGNIDVDVPESDILMSVPKYRPSYPSEFDRGGDPFPHLTGLQIDFDIYIPERVQKELASGLPLEVETERFRVHVHYDYYSPVTFVELIGVADTTAASSAVVLVRRYLEREFKADNGIRLESVGPSPFHADFFLGASSSASPGDPPFSVSIFKRPGYDVVAFAYNACDFEDVDDAFRALCEELESELGSFYLIKQRERGALYEWGPIEKDLQALIEPVSHGILSRAKAVFGRGYQIRSTFTALVQFEASALLHRHELDRVLAQLYSKHAPTYLRSFLDDERSGMQVFPTSQISQLIDALERRRSKAIELLVVLVSAVVGGIAGAVITLATK